MQRMLEARLRLHNLQESAAMRKPSVIMPPRTGRQAGISMFRSGPSILLAGPAGGCAFLTPFRQLLVAH